MTPDAFAGYRSGQSQVEAFDELLDTTDEVRPIWSELVGDVASLGAPGMRRLRERVGRLVENDGITYNEPSADAAPPSPWRLDPVPLVVSAADWNRLEAGLIQRSTVLDSVLADLYGPMRLLRDGLLPPELVFGNPAYLRVAHGLVTPGRRQLFLHGCDVSRWPDGGFRVNADWTQAPSGAGYAIADRRVAARAIPSAYEHAGPRPLTPFAQAMRLSLIDAAADSVEEPVVVVLSPGSDSETAFDQAYLASVLGFPLVESADLVVRDGKLWMRSLGTLERVHVVLRRVDAAFSDPLDLRADSRLGVVGLVEVLRRGAVTVVNTLGSGVLENPALAQFLPEITRALLDDELRLPNAPAYWGGDRAQLSHLLANLSSLVLKSTVGEASVDGRTLDAARLSELSARISAEGWKWVGREPDRFSLAPSTTRSGEIVATPVGLRMFSLAQRSGYAAMIGGLGQISAGVTDSKLRAAKDVWVRLPSRSAGVDAVASAPESRPLPAFRAPGVDVVSSPRVLADLFWMGRYGERAEDTARLLNVTRERFHEYRHRPGTAGSDTVSVLMSALAAQTDSERPSSTDVSAIAAELYELTVERARAGSLAQSVDRLGHAARAVRDQLSGDTWMVLGAVDRAIAGHVAERDPDESGLAAVHSAVLNGMLALSGLGAESMVHDTGWYVMDIGKRVERALALTALMAATLGTARSHATEQIVIDAVLGAAESRVIYRRRNRGRVRLAAVAQLLLFDEGNPRSLVFQLDALRTDFHALPGASGSSKPERLIEEASAKLRRADPAELERTDASGVRRELTELLDGVHETLRTMADVFARSRLSLPGDIQPLWGPGQRRVVS